MSRAHQHDCTTCHQPYDCGGTYWRNHDGWPEAVCTVYHEQRDTECAACYIAEACANCGCKGFRLTEDDGDQLCDGCLQERTQAAPTPAAKGRA